MTTKLEIAERIARGEVRECFTHATMGSFDVSLLRELIHVTQPRVYRTLFKDMMMVDNIHHSAVDYLLENREIDYARAAALTPEQLAEPLIMLDCPPGTNGGDASQLLVDGIHRLYERRRRGKIDIRYYLIPLHAAPRIDPEGPEWKDVPWGEKEVRNGKLVNRGDQ